MRLEERKVLAPQIIAPFPRRQRFAPKKCFDDPVSGKRIPQLAEAIRAGNEKSRVGFSAAMHSQRSSSTMATGDPVIFRAPDAGE